MLELDGAAVPVAVAVVCGEDVEVGEVWLEEGKLMPIPFELTQ